MDALGVARRWSRIAKCRVARPLNASVVGLRGDTFIVISRLFRGVSCIPWFLLLFVASSALAVEPSPIQDDAALHDVQFIGSAEGYAVGDHGVVWRTSDGGQTWRFVPVPTAASLRSASFLTSQVGWVAGVEWMPFTRLAVGVLWQTTDGGTTWHPLGDGMLPGLEHVRFFDPEEGLVVGRASPSCPTGVYRTADAGVTWKPLHGPTSPGWLAARFLSPEQGVVAGADGKLSLVGGEQLLAARLPSLGTKAIHDLTVQGNDTGWLVGDAGLVLTTASGGVSWQTPPGPLPDVVPTVFDFRCVDQRGSHVWIAGSPGSVVFHSPDAGQTWTSSPTGQTLPLHKLRFTSERNGVAVGALGTVLVTRDGGATWQTVRGKDRRVALLNLPSHSRRFRPELLAPISAEQGYRTAVHVPVNTSAVEGLGTAVEATELLSAAALRLGGNSASMGRQLGIDLPGLEINAQQLQARWQAQSEGRAAQTLVATLIREMRTWRPSVVVIEEPAADDISGEWLRQATLAAVNQARDATRELDQLDVGGLSTWSVDRVFLQLPEGSQGTVTFDLQALLPRTGNSAVMFASASRSLWEPVLPSRTSLAFRCVLPADTPSAVNDLFAGLNLAPGSGARRPLTAIKEGELELAQRRLQRTRNLLAIADKLERGSAQSAQLVAQLPDVVRELQPDQGATLMADVGRRYRQNAQFDHAEATYLELIRRYPQQPAALDAIRWLLQYWTSAEMAWQRQRFNGATQAKWTNDVAGIGQRIEQARATGSNFLVTPANATEAIPQRGVKTTNRNLANQKSLPDGAPPDSLAAWRKRAAELAAQLEQQAPALFRQPEIQFPLAALRRSRSSPGQADAIYRQFAVASPDDAMRQLVERELWLGVVSAEVPRKIISCRLATERPHLDGVLSDACWQQAEEVLLGVEDSADQSEAPVDAGNQGLVMFAYDQEFLYIAASLPRHPQASQDAPQLPGRTHDADLSLHDWLGIALDIDRDYATWYELRVDQRGFTSDRCWEDNGWNPQWYVAAEGEDARWRVEAAIPWQELTSQAPHPREAWGVSLVRTIPALAQHGWSGPTQWPPRWPSFGMLRFEGAGR
jgi:photosystem II stability/assembly factor-like uncharacterized protein